LQLGQYVYIVAGSRGEYLVQGDPATGRASTEAENQIFSYTAEPKERSDIFQGSAQAALSGGQHLICLNIFKAKWWQKYYFKD